jgi:hypothetical protein
MIKGAKRSAGRWGSSKAKGGFAGLFALLSYGFTTISHGQPVAPAAGPGARPSQSISRPRGGRASRRSG